MSGTPVVAVGTSAGGIEALHALLPRLRPEWNLAFAIVIHRQAVEDDARLETLLNSWAGVTVLKARDGDRIVPGRAVVCPADVHLIVDNSHFRLTAGPRENHSRPSVDVLFRSVATLGERGAGIVMSGLLDDGAAGIRLIRDRGGLTIAQDPDEALHSGMPRSAIAAGAQFVRAISQMDELLEAFGTPANRPEVGAIAPSTNGARLTRFTCPDCNGVLVEQQDGDFVFYRCRVGHSFSPETLDEEKASVIEDGLWAAIQVLEEQVELTERAARRARSHGNELVARRMEARAKRYRERGDIVRYALPTVEEAIETSEVRDAMD